MGVLLLSIKFADICGAPARSHAVYEVLGYKMVKDIHPVIGDI